MRRELQEELGWQPQNLNFLGSLTVEWNRRIHVHECYSNKKIHSFDLQEGREIGAFTKEEIASNTLFSKKLMKRFPVTSISAEVFKYVIAKKTYTK